MGPWGGGLTVGGEGTVTGGAAGLSGGVLAAGGHETAMESESLPPSMARPRDDTASLRASTCRQQAADTTERERWGYPSVVAG